MKDSEKVKWWRNPANPNDSNLREVLRSPACEKAEMYFFMYFYLLLNNTHVRSCNPIAIERPTIIPYTRDQSCSQTAISIPKIPLSKQVGGVIEVGEPTQLILAGPLAGTIITRPNGLNSHTTIRPICNHEKIFSNISLSARQMPQPQKSALIDLLQRVKKTRNAVLPILDLLEGLSISHDRKVILHNTQLFAKMYIE